MENVHGFVYSHHLNTYKSLDSKADSPFGRTGTVNLDKEDPSKNSPLLLRE